MHREEVDRLLPGVFQRTLAGAGQRGPLSALLDVMVALLDPREAAMQRLPSILDPRVAPERFVPLLARWLDLGLVVSTGPGFQRELIANAVELSRWRGTSEGLIRFLSIATGVSGFKVQEGVLDDKGKIKPCYIRVIAPALTKPHERMMESIIELYKPAYVTHNLVYAPSP